MEEMASLWSYQEKIDELKQKLIYTTTELESVKVQAIEEMRKSEMYVKHWLQVLETAYQERDEARDQLQRLVNELQLTAPPQLQPMSPLLNPTIATSSKPESNTLSETPIVSIFDAVSSPNLSNINAGDSSNLAFENQSFVQDYASGTPKIDQASIVIDNLVKGKTLPQKGNLLQAVLEAPPLLQTLLVAGPLPQWRNPPPLQPLEIPPVSITGGDVELVTQKPAAIPSHVAPKPLNSSSYVEMSRWCSTTLSTSTLNFANGPSGSCLGNGGLISGKRQRLQ